MKKLLLLLVIVCFGLSAQAQLRHVAGNQSIGLGIGITKDAKQISGNFGYLLQDNLGVGGRLAYEMIDLGISNSGQVYLNPSGWYMLTTINEVVFFNVKGGLIIGYEYSSYNDFDIKESGVFFGENLGLKTEFYINNKLSLDLDLEQRFFQNSIFGSQSYLISLTLNYKL